MNTTINQYSVNEKTQSLNTQKTVSNFWEKVEFNRYGITSIILLILACLGGIAAAFGADGNPIQIGLIIFPTILSLAFSLAVSPMRLIIWSCIITLAFDILVFII